MRSRCAGGPPCWKQCKSNGCRMSHTCRLPFQWCSSNCPSNQPVCWHRSMPVFRSLSPSTDSFHLLQSICNSCKHGFVAGYTDASKAAANFQIDLFRRNVRAGIIQKQWRQTHECLGITIDTDEMRFAKILSTVEYGMQRFSGNVIQVEAWQFSPMITCQRPWIPGVTFEFAFRGVGEGFRLMEWIIF